MQLLTFLGVNLLFDSGSGSSSDTKMWNSVWQKKPTRDDAYVGLGQT